MLSPQCLCAPSIKHCSYYLLPDVKHLGGVDWVQVGAFSGWLVSWQDEKHNSFMCCFFNSLTVCVQMSALIVSCTLAAGGLLHRQDIKRSYFPLKNYDHFTSVSLLNLFLISHFHHGSRFLTSFLLFLNNCPFPPSSPWFPAPLPRHSLPPQLQLPWPIWLIKTPEVGHCHEHRPFMLHAYTHRHPANTQARTVKPLCPLRSFKQALRDHKLTQHTTYKLMYLYIYSKVPQAKI